MSRLGCAGPQASFCTSPPAPIRVAIVRMRRLRPCAAKPLVSGVQVSAHRRLRSGSFPVSQQVVAPEDCIPRNVRWARTPDGPPKSALPRLVEALELDGERREFVMLVRQVQQSAGLSQCGSTHHCGNSLGRRLPGQHRVPRSSRSPLISQTNKRRVVDRMHAGSFALAVALPALPSPRPQPQGRPPPSATGPLPIGGTCNLLRRRKPKRSWATPP